MPSPITTPRVNLALALGYAVLGIAGLMLGAPPSFASPVFPAAGLALAVVLVYGLRAVPGVALGDFFMTLAYAWLNKDFNETSLAVAALTAVGAATRAAAGFWLVRRWQGDNWQIMENERDVALFVVLGGLVSGLVSASITVPGLVLFHNIAPGELVSTWWTWYVGDALGIMLFAPLSLCFLLNNKFWREARQRIVLPTLVTLSIVTAIFYAVTQWEKRSASERLHARGQRIATHISDRLIRHKEILASLGNFVEATPALSFDKFQKFTRYELRKNADISAFHLTDLVTAQGRAAYEAQMRDSSPLKKFTLTTRGRRGQLVMAGELQQHVPLRFAVPLSAYHAVPGYDYFSEPVYRQAIERAMRSRNESMTAPMLQHDETGEHTVVNLFYPLYSVDDPTNPSWSEASGFVSMGIYLDAMMNGAINADDDQRVVVQLRDVSDPLHVHVPYQSDNDFTTFSATEVRWAKTLAVADRQWELVLISNTPVVTQSRSWEIWTIGVTGLLFTSILQILMLALTGRTVAVQRKNEELQAALEHAQLADKVLANSSEAIVVTDIRGVVISVNPTFTSMTGYSAEEIQGESIGLFKSERHSPEFFQELRLELTTFRKWKGEIWHRRKNGEIFPTWMIISAVAGQDGTVRQYVGAFSDITEYKNRCDKIEFLAFHDTLTSLPNRALGASLIEQTISSKASRDKPMAMLLLGLDKFKYVNDTYGHATGDALLKLVAERLAGCTRKINFLGRMSGDEFMVVLKDVQEVDYVVEFCKNVLAQIAEPFHLQNVQLEISVSIGVALYPEHGADHDLLMRHAGMALLDAKQDGRNTYSFFHDQMNFKVVHYVQTRDALRLALERNEFELYYQPQIDLASGRVLGVEALVRWNRPYHGLIMPVNFISIAEESGLIVPLGNWVLREACRQAASWSQAGLGPLVMAVNISPIQFRRGNLESEVLGALKDSGLAPAGLELELTESLLLENADSVLATVRRLKARGVQLSIDDFGTGYSSLSYLQRFNVDKIKVDRSFVMNLLNDQSQQAIVQAIIQMAKSLNLKTIAEGVEDAMLAEKLKDLGCDEAQGYFYAKPLPAAELEQWLNRQTGP